MSVFPFSFSVSVDQKYLFKLESGEKGFKVSFKVSGRLSYDKIGAR